MKLLHWDIYEISSSETLHNIKLRGTIRKFCLENNINCLVENATDQENTVRLAILVDEDLTNIKSFLGKLVPSISIKLVFSDISNPVLSKLKVNNTERY